MTLKVLVYMPKWHQGFETRMFSLVRTLRSRGYFVDFRVATRQLELEGRAYLPCLPQQLLARKDFQEVQAKPVRSLKEFYNSAMAADVILTGNALKGWQDVENVILDVGKPFILCDDIGDILLSSYKADLVAVPGMVHYSFLSNNDLIPPERIIITGSLHLNEARSPKNNPPWKMFCERYGLDPSKKLAIVCTSASQTMDPWVKRLQEYIVRCVEESRNYQPILRLHPNDTAGHKRQWRWDDISKDSAEQLYPDVPKIEPESRIAAMNHSRLQLAITSMTAMESSIFNQNCLLVDDLEWFLNASFRGKGLFPPTRHQCFGVSRWDRTPTIESMLLDGRMRRYGLFSGLHASPFPFSWVGSACSSEELPALLDSEDIDNLDEGARKCHSSQYWFKIDGKAHERVADLIETVQYNPLLSRKLSRSRGKRLWQLSRYHLWRSLEPFVSPNALPRRFVRKTLKQYIRKD